MELFKEEGRHLKFTKDFYDLPLHKKYECISSLEPRHLLDYVTLERLILAVLQHSTKRMKEECPVKSVRKLSLQAKLADEAYNTHRVYGLEIGENFDTN